MSNQNKKVSTTWYGPGMGAVIRCPVKGCRHTTTNVITKAHLRIEHGMTREEVAEKYGYPEILRNHGFLPSVRGSNNWNSVSKTTDL